MDSLTPEELATQEDAAWDEKARRDADEASEDAYDAFMRETQEGETDRHPDLWLDLWLDLIVD